MVVLRNLGGTVRKLILPLCQKHANALTIGRTHAKFMSTRLCIDREYCVTTYFVFKDRKSLRRLPSSALQYPIEHPIRSVSASAVALALGPGFFSFAYQERIDRYIGHV